MKIRFSEDTYIRKAPITGSGDPIGIALKGAEIEVEPTPVAGEVVEGNHLWYYDKNGWYYWSGRAVAVEIPAPSPPIIPEPPPGNFSEGETRGQIELPDNSAGFSETPAPWQEDEDEPNVLPSELGAEMRTTPEAISDTSKLNWALRKFHIAHDWWEQRTLRGDNIRLAILSTGAAPNHPDMGNIIGSFQFPDSGQDLQDVHGLGTQAAVICAGAGSIFYGIAPRTQLLIAKIGTHDHTITPDGLIAGLEWSITSKADIIAMLVDFPELSTGQMGKMKALVQQALAQDILLVAPVGNSENKRPETRYPAGLEGVFSVGAHDKFAGKSSFSARSNKLDILAPGEGVEISNLDGKPIVNTRSVAIAAAFAAGFLALVCQMLRSKGQKASPDAVFSLLRDTAASRRNFNPGEDTEFGYGLLDPFAVLKRLDSSYEGPGR